MLNRFMYVLEKGRNADPAHKAQAHDMITVAREFKASREQAEHEHITLSCTGHTRN